MYTSRASTTTMMTTRTSSDSSAATLDQQRRPNSERFHKCYLQRISVLAVVLTMKFGFIRINAYEPLRRVWPNELSFVSPRIIGRYGSNLIRTSIQSSK